ncbi:MAG: hypothetical protein EOO39_46300 [Cytophagaceae bacterium]|nr:MAG: hypothetical protein EOO39_46300 [Cytophagaceae bacterium]
MKRAGGTLLFWSIYFIQDVFLIYFVNSTRHGKTGWPGLLPAIPDCLLLLLPKLLLVWFLHARVLRERAGGRALMQTVSALAASLFVYRALVCFVIHPYIYGWAADLPYFHPLGFLVALMDVGFTIAPQSYTYWNNGPGPGDNYLESDYRKEWSIETGKAAAANVVAVAKALQNTPMPGQP